MFTISPPMFSTTIGRTSFEPLAMLATCLALTTPLKGKGIDKIRGEKKGTKKKKIQKNL